MVIDVCLAVGIMYLGYALFRCYVENSAAWAEYQPKHRKKFRI